MPLVEIMNIFRQGYTCDSEKGLEEAETLLVLRRLRQVYNVTREEDLILQIKKMLSEYFPNKEIGAKDETHVQIWKGSIRESECDRMWALQNIVPQTHVLHLRSKFYTGIRGKFFGVHMYSLTSLCCGKCVGDFFNPMPTIREDAAPMLSLYENVRPAIVSVALDPEGTGPDTHYKVLQVVAQALRLGREKQVKLAVKKVWGYRNVWHRFHLSRANLAIPVTNFQMDEMHRTFLSCFGCQKKAEFPSPEYDGPFSVLGRRFRVEQLNELKTLLGESYFKDHWHPQIRQADGFVLIKEMTVDEFLKNAEDLRSKIELHNLL
ncbi:glucosamine-6-phosphate deaminase [Reticulomyxa filosa]|uniref:Glucosamine-6-phosphate deaminase n=1 Tax=Reticulomyxa filosa TaxID=46433 RepID=X6NUF7_RETFI|nr:glucosamine-6-phosphate deaminase [Reticulomyxa filosa]|eukprot:ETO29930.1 glucosamine-6-phosphate deaminase [Reticulomyxa filosa]